MSCTAEALGKIGPSVEAELQQRLSGFLGGFVRAYLPQSWVFRTEQDVASLVVDAGGRVKAVASAVPNPDVTVELSHGVLPAVLASKGRPPPPAGAVKVTAHTAKGRTAFDYVRPRLGL
jgi:hypothetical protein